MHNADVERTYTPVRALERGIDLLFALNRLGRARAGALAKEAGIDRTTTYRMLETLAAKGIVVRSGSDDSYILSSGAKRLSDGYTLNDRRLRIVSPELGRLLTNVQWPSDYATFAQGPMVIEETTHPFSPFSVHRAMIGRSRPLMRSALGQAMLAGATPARLATMLEITAHSGAEDAGEAARASNAAHLLGEFNKRGYAWSVGGTESHISAIALPVIVHGEAIGAVNILFFRSALTIDQAAARFLEPFRASISAMKVRLEADEDAIPG